jgi:protein gp37
MATNTSIEWADKTWSPIIGCDRVSPGCDRCYAITTAHIRKSNPNPTVAAAFAGTTQRVNNVTDWSGKVNLLGDRLFQPLRWKNPVKVFVNSMSDLFHEQVPTEFIAKVFAVMALTPQHTYQILTKRHARMRSLLSSPSFRLACEDAEAEVVSDEAAPIPRYKRDAYRKQWWSNFAKPLPNVWLGVSVENQKWADIRIPALLSTPAAVRFLSCEPLLGPIDLTAYLADRLPVTDPEADAPDGSRVNGMERHGDEWVRQQALHWAIVGGESGHGARAMHPDWARSLRDQCAAADVPFLFKQWGEWGPAPFIVRVCDPETGWTGTAEELAAAKADSEAKGGTHAHTGNWYEENGERSYWIHAIGHKPWSLERVTLPEHTESIRRWGKKAAGRELDGRQHNDFPRGRS